MALEGLTNTENSTWDRALDGVSLVFSAVVVGGGIVDDAMDGARTAGKADGASDAIKKFRQQHADGFSDTKNAIKLKQKNKPGMHYTGEYDEGGMWTPGKPGDIRRNLEEHWKRHRADFPEMKNADEYAEAAHEFKYLHSPKKRNAKNGDLAYYDAETNTFLITDKNNTPKTFMRLTEGEAYFDELPDFWHDL